jgi:hypothetical protein
MSKEKELPGIISPVNLWGKPLPRPTGSEVTAETADDPADEEVAAEEEPADGMDVEDDFEPEEGDEAVEEDAEDSPEAIAAEDEDADGNPRPLTSAAMSERTEVMATAKSNADHVRAEIERRRIAGESLRGVEIVAALKSRRVVVSPAQVSQLLKKAGVAQKTRGASRVPATAAAGERSRVLAQSAKVIEPRTRASTAPVANELSSDRRTKLTAAKAFVAACGGSYSDAVSALELYHELSELMS